MFKIGLNIGSTTAKIVVIDENDKIIFSRYRRHNTQMMDVVLSYLNELESIIGNEKVSLNVSGSVGMGLAELYDFPFIQEVVAASKIIQRHYPIHIGSRLRDKNAYLILRRSSFLHPRSEKRVQEKSLDKRLRHHLARTWRTHNCHWSSSFKT